MGDLVPAAPDPAAEESPGILRLRPGPERRPGLLVTGTDRFRDLLDRTRVRTLKGWVLVAGEVLDDDVLDEWLREAWEVAARLPPK
ncbi:hypothetical protein GCM10010245_88510 [Streptomyces spectabilis]|nr:hypothetical protein GCM10010245_88510 [Streptomyces spectabilis]